MMDRYAVGFFLYMALFFGGMTVVQFVPAIGPYFLGLMLLLSIVIVFVGNVAGSQR
jgi:hypothetical protein